MTDSTNQLLSKWQLKKNRSILDFPVCCESTLEWGMMDLFKHINNISYLRFFENARVAYLQKLGCMNLDDGTESGFTMGDIYIKYLRPLHYPDVVITGASIRDIEEKQVTMDYSIYSNSQQRIVTIGYSTLVCIDFISMKKRKIPNPLIAKIESIENFPKTAN